MDTGTIFTAILAGVITFCFFLGVKRIVRNFSRGDCCDSGGCTGCCGICHSDAVEKDSSSKTR